MPRSPAVCCNVEGEVDILTQAQSELYISKLDLYAPSSPVRHSSRHQESTPNTSATYHVATNREYSAIVMNRPAIVEQPAAIHIAEQKMETEVITEGSARAGGMFACCCAGGSHAAAAVELSHESSVQLDGSVQMEGHAEGGVCLACCGQRKGGVKSSASLYGEHLGMTKEVSLNAAAGSDIQSSSVVGGASPRSKLYSNEDPEPFLTSGSVHASGGMMAACCGPRKSSPRASVVHTTSAEGAVSVHVPTNSKPDPFMGERTKSSSFTGSVKSRSSAKLVINEQSNESIQIHQGRQARKGGVLGVCCGGPASDSALEHSALATTLTQEDIKSSFHEKSSVTQSGDVSVHLARDAKADAFLGFSAAAAGGISLSGGGLTSSSESETARVHRAAEVKTTLRQSETELTSESLALHTEAKKSGGLLAVCCGGRHGEAMSGDILVGDGVRSGPSIHLGLDATPDIFMRENSAGGVLMTDRDVSTPSSQYEYQEAVYSMARESPRAPILSRVDEKGEKRKGGKSVVCCRSAAGVEADESEICLEKVSDGHVSASPRSRRRGAGLFCATVHDQDESYTLSFPEGDGYGDFTSDVVSALLPPEINMKRTITKAAATDTSDQTRHYRALQYTGNMTRSILAAGSGSCGVHMMATRKYTAVFDNEALHADIIDPARAALREGHLHWSSANFNLSCEGREPLHLRFELSAERKLISVVTVQLHDAALKNVEMECEHITIDCRRGTDPTVFTDRYTTLPGKTPVAVKSVIGFALNKSEIQLLDESCTQLLVIATSFSTLAPVDNVGAELAKIYASADFQKPPTPIADVTLVCDRDVFPATRAVLMSRSSVFYQMLAGKSRAVIAVTGATPDVVKNMVDYIHTDKCQALTLSDDVPLMVKIYELAVRFNVLTLKDELALAICVRLTPDNVQLVRTSAIKTRNAALLASASVYSNAM